MDGGDTGWLKVERAGAGGPGEEGPEREHNVSHSARSCIFYDMASNLTSRARHNSRPCSPCARPPHRPPSFPLRRIALALDCVQACAPNTRAHEESPHARTRVHTYVLRGTGTRASERIETIRGRDSS